MITLIRTDSTNADFQKLVRFLDQELAVLDGEEHSFYAQFNKIDSRRHAVVAYLNGVPIGCGAIKAYATGVGELKRMYVPKEYRRQGVARHVLQALETWAGELNFAELILETGKAQPEAIALYQKMGYTIMPNYGQYAGVDNSVCMKKCILQGKKSSPVI